MAPVEVSMTTFRGNLAIVGIAAVLGVVAVALLVARLTTGDGAHPGGLAAAFAQAPDHGGRGFGSLGSTADTTLVGADSNSAYYVWLVRSGARVHGEIEVSTVNSPLNVQQTGAAFYGVLTGSQLKLGLVGRLFGARSLTGRFSGGDLVVINPRGYGQKLMLVPGMLGRFNELYDRLVAQARTA